MQVCSNSSFAQARTRAPSRARASTNELKKRHDHAERNEPKTAATSACRPKHARTQARWCSLLSMHIRVHARTRAVTLRSCEHARTQETTWPRRAERALRPHLPTGGSTRDPSRLSRPAIHARPRAHPNPSHDPNAARGTIPRRTSHGAIQASPRARSNPSGPCPMRPHARPFMLDGPHPDGPPPLTARCSRRPGRSSRR